MKLLARWILLTCYLTISLWGRDIPEYVTAWPKQVSVEKPDPVLGDKLVWEHWIYSEKFAKRFNGFSFEQADSELKNSLIQAIVLRIYKKNLWMGVNDSYPDQYATDIDLYFDDTIQIALSEKQRKYKKSDNYPEGIEESYKSLKPIDPSDNHKLQTVKPVDFFFKQPIIIFTAPLDGRFSSLGAMYYPKLVDGMSLLSLKSRILGGVAVPLANNGSLWLSLFGARSYKNQVITESPIAAGGLYTVTTGDFIVDEHPKVHGFIRLPKTFTEITLPKMALINDLNYCINQEHAYTNSKHKSDTQKSYDALMEWCDNTKKQGKIFEPRDYLFQRLKREGLFEIGF